MSVCFNNQTWPESWQGSNLDLDLQAEYAVQAVAVGTDGLFVLAHSWQKRTGANGTQTAHKLSYEVPLLTQSI